MDVKHEQIIIDSDAESQSLFESPIARPNVPDVNTSNTNKEHVNDDNGTLKATRARIVQTGSLEEKQIPCDDIRSEKNEEHYGRLIDKNYYFSRLSKLDTFDTVAFIEMIRKRPAVWDVQCNEYSDKFAKQKCWSEIYRGMQEGFEDESEQMKNKRTTDLHRRWKSLRNSFTRELSKQKFAKPGDGASNRRQYMYFDLLSFLKPSITINSTISSFEHPVEEKQDEVRPEKRPTTEKILITEDRAITKEKPRTEKGLRTEKRLLKREPGQITKRKKHGRTDKLKTLKDTLRRSIQLRSAKDLTVEDADKLFLISLHGHLKSIPDPMKLLAKSEIIQVLAKYNTCNVQPADPFSNTNSVPVISSPVQTLPHNQNRSQNYITPSRPYTQKNSSGISNSRVSSPNSKQDSEDSSISSESSDE